MSLPIAHWSHSSLISYLRNPLAFKKRYIDKVYDTPSTPAGIIGRAGHIALQHFYSGIAKDGAIQLGLENLRSVPDFEINFGVAKTKKAQKEKRKKMEQDYLQAIGFYLAKPPRYKPVAIEYSNTVEVPSLPLPLKAISDLVVPSRKEKGALDIVDHKFVDSFSKDKADKTLFVIQALFNYYTVSIGFQKPVRRFIVHECKKSLNRDGKPQMRRYVLDFAECADKAEFYLFHRLIRDVTKDMSQREVFLPNPSDMFEGENSFDIYRLGLQS